MSDSKWFNRRRFMTLSGSIAVTALAGCSDNGDTSTEPDTDTTTSDGAQSEGSTATDGGSTDDMTSEPPSSELIDSLSDYRYVANHPDEWVGESIRAENVNYYEPYQEDYQGFRAVYEEQDEGRPFMLKTDKQFHDNEEISFSGTVEKTGELQGVKIIFVENFTIE